MKTLSKKSIVKGALCALVAAVVTVQSHPFYDWELVKGGSDYDMYYLRNGPAAPARCAAIITLDWTIHDGKEWYYSHGSLGNSGHLVYTDDNLSTYALWEPTVQDPNPTYYAGTDN